jgi:hypothetical protein
MKKRAILPYLWMPIGVLLVCIVGCSKKQPLFETGKITDISGTLPTIMKSAGAMFGNESVKLGDQTLILTVSTPNGHYVIDIENCVYGPQTINNLCVAIKVGDTIKFPISNYRDINGWRREIKFSPGKLGKLRSTDIEIIRQEKP